MHDWIDKKISDSRETIAKKSAALEELQHDLAAVDGQHDRRVEGKIADLETELNAEQWALFGYDAASRTSIGTCLSARSTRSP